MISNRFLACVAAGLALASVSSRAQNVEVSGTLTDVPAAGGVFDYTLTLKNTGSEGIESLWLGWALSSNPTFDIVNPTNAGNNLGWASPVDGNSIQYGGSPSETILASGSTAIFTFDSTSTPAQFKSGAAGQSVAYGTNAPQFAIEDDSLDSIEFSPTVVPEPSTVSLLVAGALAVSWPGRRRPGRLVSLFPRLQKSTSPQL